MARLHGASWRVRRVAVGVAAAVVLVTGPAGARPAQAATTGTHSPTTVTTTTTARGTASGGPAQLELEVDYGGQPSRPTGPDPAVVALVIAAGAHLLGIGAWATTRVARARREELSPTLPSLAGRRQRVG